MVFTDEWGGGLGARCRPNDPNKWGADAIFNLNHDKLTFANYYKLPAAQGDSENCVAHNGSLVPVPGRDIEVQAWYQGGISVVDFTDTSHPFEIAYFDRGPIDPKVLVLGGEWSAYWYNGTIYGSEIARGMDTFELTPTKFLTQNEIDAAKAFQSIRAERAKSAKDRMAGAVDRRQGLSGSVIALASLAGRQARQSPKSRSGRRNLAPEQRQSRQAPADGSIAGTDRRRRKNACRRRAPACPGRNPEAPNGLTTAGARLPSVSENVAEFAAAFASTGTFLCLSVEGPVPDAARTNQRKTK